MTKNNFHTSPATVPLDADRPLLITDADEVLLRFVDGFIRFLDARGLTLDLSSYRLHGNVTRHDDGTKLIDVEVTVLLEEFRSDLDSLDAVEHAAEVLAGLRGRMQTVVLSNVTPAQAPARVRNLARLGFDFPLLVNSGPKGEAVKALAQRAGTPAFFMDDIPQHLAHAAETAPQVFRIHLVGDERLKPLMPPAPAAHLRAEDWRAAEAFIRARLPQ
ncbi:MAG: hypothetical protein KGR48_01915 [Alphaproteobacteria bacterium]|nr:hypothetical protein [Alphaproteobacteria bacterium]MBU6472236.1 hypothetical protein [Alphaproteobacteria bacterium]MDE2012565.1 hypothetical protein [Alphaproteobacteria bacterium]MDE2073430.1 hypothetical protein [Alphaproteobacteria bacterium]MDE2350954.1 hypothetical protein [Alphaproteobacteria bacterium]